MFPSTILSAWSPPSPTIPTHPRAEAFNMLWYCRQQLCSGAPCALPALSKPPSAFTHVSDNPETTTTSVCVDRPGSYAYQSDGSAVNIIISNLYY